ncbi:XK-related protein 9-like [Dermacentor variabilis]|uniref:XK-related protein 9-like n=1 Tax=Dermacentor variabilis TaxID=34621 RepID=UPI003F5C811B
MTLLFVLMPSLVVNVCSFRWHIHDKRVSKVIWVASVLQLGVLHRYWLCLRAGLKAERTRDVDDFHELYRHPSDLCMLRLFDSFLESAPQLVLQLYIMVNHEDWNPWTAIGGMSSCDIVFLCKANIMKKPAVYTTNVHTTTSDYEGLRYWLCLRAGLKAERTRDVDDFHELYRHPSDLCMLRLFDSFLESAPQLVLQLYIMVNHEDWNPWTGQYQGILC